MKTAINRHKKIGQLIKLNGRIINYFAWIANLGVVPLFLLCAFLLAPELIFFAFLLFVVTLVLDTILKLLSSEITDVIMYFKLLFLSMFGQSVKEFVVFAALVSQVSTCLYAQESNLDLIMTKGEVQNHKMSQIQNYSVSNKEVTKLKYNPTKSELLIKAVGIGHSTINIFNKDGSRKSINILVANKIHDAKLTELIYLFSNYNLNAQNIGTQIKITGELTSPSTYFEIQKTIQRNKDSIINKTKILEQTKIEILGNIYAQLLKDNIDFIKCDFVLEKLICTMMDYETISESYKQDFEEQYSTKIIIIYPNLKKNYTVKLKLLQLEKLDGEEISFGLEQLSASLGDIMNTPITRIIEKNQVNLANHNMHLSTLAEPQIVGTLRSNSSISLGSELSYKTLDTTKNTTNIEWKFAGLKLKINLDQSLDKIKISYDTELSRPQDENNSISGSKQQSIVVAPLNTPLLLFKITLKTEGKKIESMPFLAKIPILGEIFKSKSNSDNFKTITGIIEVSENE